MFGIKKDKDKKVVKKKKKKVEQKKEEKEDIVKPEKPKKNEKESHYRIYFSGRNSVAEKRAVTKELLKKETKECGVQATFVEKNILKGSVNIISSSNFMLEKKSSLMVTGQKVEE